MREELRRINPSKALVLDHIKERVVKECADELAGVICQLYNHSLSEMIAPQLWKLSEIRPIPKNNHLVELNDYRPMALTSVLVKCLERLVLRCLLSQISPSLDPLQCLTSVPNCRSSRWSLA